MVSPVTYRAVELLFAVELWFDTFMRIDELSEWVSAASQRAGVDVEVECICGGQRPDDDEE